MKPEKCDESDYVAGYVSKTVLDCLMNLKTCLNSSDISSGPSWNKFKYFEIHIFKITPYGTGRVVEPDDLIFRNGMVKAIVRVKSIASYFFQKFSKMLWCKSFLYNSILNFI